MQVSVNFIIMMAVASGLTLSKPTSVSTGMNARQEPEYYDGYAYQTPDAFSVDLWELQGQGLGTKYSNLLNVSTSYGGRQFVFNCNASQHTNSKNLSQWLTFAGPNVPGSSSPVLQGNVSLFPANMCKGAKIGPKSFDKVLLSYQGETIAVSSSDDCQRWNKPGGSVNSTGPIARCVLELTPA